MMMKERIKDEDDVKTSFTRTSHADRINFELTLNTANRVGWCLMLQ